ncbi:DUF4349 domain-containing protein [Nocardioides sp. J54]|uniref:DUF4349 domain-containing protein n=1 Tax=Nocardioides sp. J54 TaxID=935866 RepID=UPI0004B54EA8|nr:DUF4349 domain-containing protein [Nocardioides sp. J54]
MNPTNPRPTSRSRSRSRSRTRPPALLAALVALVAVLLAGCAGSGSDSSSGADVAMSEAEPADIGDEGRAAGAEAEAADAAQGDDAAGVARVVDPGRDAARVSPGAAVIRTGTIGLESEDVGKARFDVRKVVDMYRGTITDQETSTAEEGRLGTARLVARVPSDSFDDATRELEEVATLLGSTTSGEDVSTEVVDVAARVRAQRASVARVQALLAQAKDIQQVISVERELATRQADLDSLVARQEYLADQTSFSTITVTIEQPDGDRADEEDETDGFVEGLAAGWDSFVGGLVAILTVVGFLLPWLGLLALVVAPLWLLVRRRGARRSAPPAPAGP